MQDATSEARYLRDLGKYDEATEILRCALAAANGVGRLSTLSELATTLKNQGLWKDSFEALQDGIQSASDEDKEQPIFLQLQMDALLLRPCVLASFKGVQVQASAVFRRLLELRSTGLVHELGSLWVRLLDVKCLDAQDYGKLIILT